jgi:predicted nucleic acid-binding protein
MNSVATPLIGLAVIGQFDLLRQMFGEILIAKSAAVARLPN